MTSGPSFTSEDSPLSVALSLKDGELIEVVRNALNKKNVMLAYQPVLRAGAGQQIAFYEGLMRVLDDSGRVIPARGFIDQIEAHQEGRLVDCLGLEMALKALREDPGIRLSINMSARSIGHPAWEKTLNDGLSSDETIAERLMLEITESSAMTMPELVIEFMDRLQLKGITFALDDFGAGYTSFRHFKDFQFDIVKIDASFVHNIDSDPDNQVITNALILIAQQFDMFTVAEGVQTAAEAAYLAKSGVDCLQGYYYAAPSVNANLYSSGTELSRTG